MIARALLLLGLLAAAARAEPPHRAPASLADSLDGEARADYERARRLYADGLYGDALALLEHAFATSRDPRLVWNMAACENKRHHYAKALALVEKYLTASGSLLSDADRRAAREFSAAVRAFVGDVAVTANVDGVSIEIDGELVGTTPLPARLLVDEGAHQVRFARSGYEEVVRKETVLGAKPLTWAVELRKEAPAAAVAAPEAAPTVSAPATRRRPLRNPALAAGAGLLAAAAGAVLVGVTASDYATLARDCAPICSPSRYAADQALQPTGVALIGVGAAVILAAIVWWLVPPRARAVGP
jgi:hypothetical protein